MVELVVAVRLIRRRDAFFTPTTLEIGGNDLMQLCEVDLTPAKR